MSLDSAVSPPMPSSALRRIAHLDMDAFYASVELLRYPQLKGMPVVIGGPRSAADERRLATYVGRLHDAPLAAFDRLKSYTGRGVITTATYDARAFGVGSAMGLMKAAKLCPEAVLLPVTFDEYRSVSQAFKAAVQALAPLMEDRGVDEIYLDLTEQAQAWDGGESVAQQLQAAVLAATGLTCSIGVAPNKLLAKMASELNKPRGISIVWADELSSKIWPLAVRKINGIGPKAEAKLHTAGIHTIGELAQRSSAALVAQFGKHYGAWLHAAAHGRDDSPVVTHSEPVSMSRETTFERDLHAVHDRAQLGEIFTDLCTRLAADLQRKGYVAKTIGIKIKYHDYSSVTRDQTIEIRTNDAALIRRTAGICLKRADLSQRFRLLGVKAGQLLQLEHLTQVNEAKKMQKTDKMNLCLPL
jgi:DNA polymerase IV